MRTDFTAGEVRQFAKRAQDAAQARRLLAITPVEALVPGRDAGRSEEQADLASPSRS